MRKRLIYSAPGGGPPEPQPWLNLERLAEVEVTSEDPQHPIERALIEGEHSGWVAGDAGPQLIRIVFDAPQRIRRIQVVFNETAAERTQEYVLRWSPDTDSPGREIVRQQWNFSPTGSTRQMEDYQVDLAGVRILELGIVPNISGGQDRASLSAFRLA